MNTILPTITADTKFLVQNSDSEGLPPFSIEDFNKIYQVPSHMRCPVCKEMMCRKKEYPSHKDERIIVCGHVELVGLPIFKYVTLICNKCNSEKRNLPPFSIRLGDLLPLSEVYRLSYTHRHQKI